MASFEVLTIVIACAFFVVSLLGGIAVLWIAGLSPQWIQLCNALAGGVVIGVALCHMLGDNVGTLEPWGQSINKALGGESDDSMPLGLAMAGCGFFLVVGIEHVLHSVGKDVEMSESQSASALEAGQTQLAQSQSLSTFSADGRRQLAQPDDSVANPKPLLSHVGGITTFVSISIHSTIEGIATGATADERTFTIVALAILLHKGFAAFAVAASLQSMAKERVALWWTAVIAFALTGSIGIAVGYVLRENIEGRSSAFLQCIAAGTLLGVGINEMLIPALSDVGVWKKRKLVAACVGYFAMAILSIWA